MVPEEAEAEGRARVVEEVQQRALVPLAIAMLLPCFFRALA